MRPTDEMIAEWRGDVDAVSMDSGVDIEPIINAVVAERDRADKAEARIARALDLIGEWRSSEVPVTAPHTAMQEVKVRLRILYALLDGEEGWHYAEPGICNVCGGRGCDDPEGCPKPGEVSGE